jgi:2-dehydro-3-deoxyglucarate aldolase
MSNPVKSKIRRGQPSFGSWIASAHVSVAEILASSGFDWIVVDMEHSNIVLSDLPALFAVFEKQGVLPLVRLPENDPSMLRRVLDTGAGGVIVPMVNSRKDAERVVQAAKYPPEGRRGVGIARAHAYGKKFKQHVKSSNDDVLIVVQIEHIDAVRNAESIFSVPGVDAYMIGPYDLSGSLGIPGQLADPRVEEAKERVLKSGKKKRIVPGIHLVHPSEPDLDRALELGYRFIALSSDILLLGEASDRVFQMAEAALSRRRKPQGGVPISRTLGKPQGGVPISRTFLKRR